MSTRQAEEAIFRSLLQAAPDGILVCDQHGRIIIANEQVERMLGYTTGELIGQEVEVLVPEYIRPKHAALRDGYFGNPRRRPMGIGLDLVATRKGGATVPVEISLSPFELEGAPCAIAVVRDVTELRRLDRELKHNNQELRRSNQELEQFAYVASHDLQEPLRMVAGYTQLLQRRYGDKLDADAKEYIGFAVDGVKRMQALINDLLTYARVAPRAKPFAAVALADAATQALSNLEVAIEEGRAQITVEPLPVVRGDVVQLTQLLQNLVSNALKFRAEGRPVAVAIRARREDAVWRVSVEDHGIGIEPAYAEKVFVIFQRLHGRDAYPGTGIGLAIAKRVVERHGGRIWFEPTAGGGTTFHFTLPAEDDR
jgi:PAS domain S-box-containing protein